MTAICLPDDYSFSIEMYDDGLTLQEDVWPFKSYPDNIDVILPYEI